MGRDGHTRYLLGDEEHVDGAQVEVVKEGQGGQAVVGGVLAGVKLQFGQSVGRRALQASGRSETRRRTMMVLPLYWMMWHERPTSLPPPRQRNMSSSAGSTGSSGAAAPAMAAALRLEAMVMRCWGSGVLGFGGGGVLTMDLVVQHDPWSIVCGEFNMQHLPSFKC